MPRKPKPLSTKARAQYEVERQLKSLGVSHGYVPMRLDAPGQMAAIPAAEYPRVFRALYEAVDAVQTWRHERRIGPRTGAYRARVLILRTDGRGSDVVWDSDTDEEDYEKRRITERMWSSKRSASRSRHVTPFKVEHRGMVHRSFVDRAEALRYAERLARSTATGEHIGVRAPSGQIEHRYPGKVRA